MAEKKQVEAITGRDEDFAKWYTDIVKKAELIEYTSVKGCMVIRPYGYAIWENIQRILDGRFKATGHENVCMPMFISESLLQKEKDHVEGFAPEVAWVTYGGNEKLEERLCVRPTSETLFCEHYANIIHSYRDLPKLYNQWVSVVRWEKTTRPFLRSREFLWQEGHTVHATAEEAIAETERMLDLYADFCEQSLAMPVVRGRKTESDKFAGADYVERAEGGIYGLKKYCLSRILAKVADTADLGSHILFAADVLDCDILARERPVTYAYYLENIKPKPAQNGLKGFRCKVCGYFVEKDVLPPDFTCPVCKHPASDFERVG